MSLPFIFFRSVARLSLATVALIAGASAWAQSDYPSRSISLVLPFAAGSGTDGVGRIIAQKLTERLGQPVVVDNRPGANGAIAADLVARAAPDGYTLFMTTNTTHSANPALYKNLRYDPIKDFTPIVRTGELGFAVTVNKELPVRSMQDLIDHARRHPGTLSYGTPNSTSLVASETLKALAKIDITAVPYKSSPQAMTDVIANQIQVYVVDFGSGGSFMKTGKVRTLALTPARGSKIYPDIPSVAKTLPGFDLTSWNGIFGPAGLPDAIVERLSREINTVLADPATQQQLADGGFEVWPTSSPQAFGRYVAEQLELWGGLIRSAGIQPE